jgi:predicted metal-dependent hydrolase
MKTRTPRKNKWHDIEDLHWAVRHWATRMNVQSPTVQMRAMRRKWASLSRRGRLTVDAKLLDLPRDLGEYVIVHELVHLLVPSHSKLFKSYLHAYLPDWEARQARLNKVQRTPKKLGHQPK